MMNKNIRIALYTRCSGPEAQPSLEHQEARLRATVEARFSGGCEIVRVYRDVGPCGRDLPGWRRLVESIIAHEVEVVAVASLDRVSRDVRRVAEKLRVFQDHRAHLFSAAESFDTSAALGRVMLNLLLAFADCEPDPDTNYIDPSGARPSR